MEKTVEIKEPELKALIAKCEMLISEALKTDNQIAHEAANHLYYYINQKFYKYLENENN